MGDVLSMYSTVMACLWLPSFRYRNTQQPVGDACSLSLAITGSCAVVEGLVHKK